MKNDASFRGSEDRELVSRIKMLWQRDAKPDAIGFLSQHSRIRQNRSLALEVAYEEYCIRRDAGESIRASTFVQRFPSISRSLARQIEVDEYVRANPAIVAKSQDVDWPRRGQNLFDFTVLDEIGRGAFARAYLCEQRGIGDRQVVVKVSQGGAAEANTMGSLDHDNIMPIYSVVEDPKTHLTVICMPFVGRSTLFDIIDLAFAQQRPPKNASVIAEASRAMRRRGDVYQRHQQGKRLSSKMPYVTGVLQIAKQLSEALAHAHERGVLHGDVKPSNTVMSIHGSPFLVDFNLSQSRESNNFVTGGTLPYMAPEQIRSLILGSDVEDRVDERSDIYSLGAIMYEMLVGHPPFVGDPDETEPYALAGRMLDAQSAAFEPIRQANPDVDPAFADLVSRCLAFDAKLRPVSMSQVSSELSQCLSGSHRVRRWFRHNRMETAAIGISLLLATGAAGSWLASRPPEDIRYRTKVAKVYTNGDYNTALKMLTELIGKYPATANDYVLRGCSALKIYEANQFQGFLDSAFSDLTKARRIAKGDDSKVDDAMAYCLILQGQAQDAAELYEQLIESSDSIDASHWNNLGYCYVKDRSTIYSRNGRNEALAKADHAYQEAMRLDPEAIVPKINFVLLELERYRANKDLIPLKGYDVALELLDEKEQVTDSITFNVAARLCAVLFEETTEEKYEASAIRFLEAALERGLDTDRILQEKVVSPSDPRLKKLLKRDWAGGAQVSPKRSMFPKQLANGTDIVGKTDAS